MAQIKLTITADTQGVQKSVEQIKNQFTALSQQLSTLTVNKDLTAQINALSKYYKSLASAAEKVTVSTEKRQLAEQRLATEVERTKKAHASYLRVANSIKASNTSQQDQLLQLRTQWNQLALSVKSVEKSYPKNTFLGVTEEINQQISTLDKLSVTDENFSSQLKKSKSALVAQKEAFSSARNSATNYHGSIRDIIAGFAKFQLSAMLVMKPLQMMQNALSSINETLVETENAVVGIARVLDENVSNGEISSEIYRIAQELGQTFDVVQEIAQNFAKAGLDWQDTLKATEAAVLALNVAELTAEESSEGLIAIMQQFGYEAEDLTYIIDVLNKTADKSAVDTQELLVALEKTGSYAKASNLTLEQTVALITAISEATAASGQNIGNALKSLFAYSSKDSALDVFASLSTDSAKVVEEYRRGAASILDVWRQLSEEINNLTAEQGRKLDEYFASEEGSALEEALGGDLAEIQDSIKGVYDSAGVYRKNYFIALLGNMEEVDNVLGDLSDVAGYTMTEQEKYMETYTAKVNELKSAWQALVNDEQGWLGFKKGLAELGTWVINIIDDIGGLQTVISAIATAVIFLFGDKIISGIKTFGSSLKNIATGFTAAATSAQTFQAALGAVGLALTALQVVFGLINRELEKAEQERKEQEEANAKAIEDANDAIEANKSVVQSITAYADSVKELRDILSDSTSTDEEKQAAQEQLLSIQEELIKNNGSYKDSLDLVNGSIEEQLGLIEKLTDEQLAQQAQDWLKENSAAIELAKAETSKEGTSSLGTSLGVGYGSGRDEQASSVINDIIHQAGVDNAEAIFEHYDGFVAEYYKGFEDAYKGGDEIGGVLGGVLASLGWGFGGLLEMVGDMGTPEGWTGSSSATIGVSGTIAEQIATWEALKTTIAESEKLSAEQKTAAAKEIDEILASLNSAEYQEAERLMEVYDATEKLLNKEISREEYLEIVYGITSATKEEGSAVEDLAEKYDDLIKKLKELKDAQKDAWDWAESKQDVIDAQKELEEAEKALQEAQEAALQNNIDLTDEQNDLLEAQNALLKARQALERAKNERTVRRFSSTGNQWEWQTDEDKVADAQEALLEAQDDLLEAQQDIVDAQNDAKEKLQEAIEDAQEDLENAQERLAEAQYKLEQAAYEKIIEDLEDGLATNESIEAILQEIKPLLGADSTLASDIANAIHEVFGDEGLPEETDDKGDGGDKDSGSSSKPSGGGKPSGAVGGGGGKFAQSQLFYDSGGVAKGRGLFAKDTDRHESIINDPDLTEKILSPVPSKQFDRYVRDMGILFEHARVYEQSPVMRSVVGNTDNSIDNSRQVIIKDVNVGAQKRDSLVDALGLAALVD